MVDTQGPELLKAALERLGWSQNKLEREAPCARGYVSRLLSGKSEPGSRLAARFEELLGVPAVSWGKPARKRRTAKN